MNASIVDAGSANAVSVRVLGICGSLRQGSHNRRLLRAAGALLAPAAEFIEWDGLKAVPPFDEDDEATPPAGVRAMRAAIAHADAVIGASPSAYGAVWAQAEVRKALQASGARVLQAELAIPHVHQQLGFDDRFMDAAVSARLQQLLQELTAAAQLEGQARVA